MVQHEVQEDGKLVVYEREIKGDEMHVVRLSFIKFTDFSLNIKIKKSVVLLIACILCTTESYLR